ncbi:MAG: Bro-N domain-containing protein, partial [Lachnospiraceae bacterium]|nr:Bro-N domain-containing protein [Lachnospiraceae bacterium]
MKDLQIFNNPEFGEIRTVNVDGEPWLVGKDVAHALGYEKPTDAIRKRVDDEDKGVSKMETPSGQQDMIGI